MGAPQQMLAGYGESLPGNGVTDPYFASVSLLLHGNGANGGTTFVDSSTNNRSISVSGTVTTSTAEKKYGSAAIAYGASSSYLYTPDFSGFDMGSGDFTMEAWVYLNASGVSPLFSQRTASNNQWYLYISVDAISSYAVASGVAFHNVSVAPTLAATAWHHIAMCRDGGTMRFYLDGVQCATAAVSGNWPRIAVDLRIGNDYAATYASSDYHDDIRITKGVCRYPSGTTFTPPTTEAGDS